MQHNAVCYCHVSLINGTVDKNMYSILTSKIRNVFALPVWSTVAWSTVVQLGRL